MPINRRIEKLSFFVSFLLISSFSYSQENTYEFIENGSVNDLSVYTEAMNMANFDAYRFMSKRRLIRFKSGVVISLLSEQELLEKGFQITDSKAIPDEINLTNEPIFELRENGYIRVNHTALPSK
jgi:hypothetical protein